MDWTPGGGSANEKYGDVVVFVGKDKNAVNGNCGYANGENPSCYYPNCRQGCTAAITLPSTVYSTSIGNLSPGTVYYVRAVSRFYREKCKKDECTILGGYCGSPGAKGYVSSCSVDPAAATVAQGQTITLSTTLNASSYIDHVGYSGNSAYMSFDPSSDIASPYQTALTGLQPTEPGFQPAISAVYLKGEAVSKCTATSEITVTAPLNSDPWWQAEDSDVIDIS